VRTWEFSLCILWPFCPTRLEISIFQNTHRDFENQFNLIQALWEPFEIKKCRYVFKNTFNLGENVRIIFVYILNILPNSTKKKFPIIPYSLVIFVECQWVYQSPIDWQRVKRKRTCWQRRRSPGCYCCVRSQLFSGNLYGKSLPNVNGIAV